MSGNWPITCSPKCAVKHVGKLTEIRHRNNTYDTMLNQSEITPLYSREFYIQVGPHYNKFNVKCKKCGYEFTSSINLSFFNRFEGNNFFRCPYCYPMIKSRSIQEEKIFNYIKDDLGYSDLLCSYHEIIKPYELDIYVPSKKTAFEFNGICWHSLENSIKTDYHLNKTMLCEAIGVKLVHIWEDEWNENPNKIKQFILEVLNGSYCVDVIIDNGRKLIDRSQFNKVALNEKTINIINELAPVIVKRRSFNVPNCGYFEVE